MPNYAPIDLGELDRLVDRGRLGQGDEQNVREGRIAQALGARVRSMPFTRARIAALLR